MSRAGRQRRSARPARGDRGAVTAELAMALPILVAVVIGLVWLLSVGAAQVRAVDAAREAARSLARGDPEAEAVQRAGEVAGAGAAVQVAGSGGELRVTVTRQVAGPGGLFAFIPGMEVRATAVGASEQPP